MLCASQLTDLPGALRQTFSGCVTFAAAGPHCSQPSAVLQHWRFLGHQPLPGSPAELHSWQPPHPKVPRWYVKSFSLESPPICLPAHLPGCKRLSARHHPPACRQPPCQRLLTGLHCLHTQHLQPSSLSPGLHVVFGAPALPAMPCHMCSHVMAGACRLECAHASGVHWAARCPERARAVGAAGCVVGVCEAPTHRPCGRPCSLLHGSTHRPLQPRCGCAPGPAYWLRG